MRVAMALCCALFMASAARAAAEPPAAPRTIEELRLAVAAVLQREGVPGAGLAVVEDGHLTWAGGVGLADRERRAPVTADTLFRVGSVTKSFIALALLKQVDLGRLDLRARVSELAPEIAIENRWAATHPITVAHCLEHTAGFDDMRFNETYAPLDAESLPLVDVLARNPRSRVARWRPGSRGAYANPGYTVAARVLERGAGRAYEDRVRDDILLPMGMSGARLRWSPEVEARLARGYDEDGALVPYRAIYHRPAGNLMASPRELAALVELHLSRGGGVVSPAAVARMERSETSDLSGTDVDYGLGNAGEVFLPLPARGHTGGIDGFLSSVGYMPSARAGWVVLVNSTRSHRAPDEIVDLVAAYLLRGRAVAPPPRVPVPDARLARWAGTYRHDAPRHQLFAFLDELGPRLEITHAPGHLSVGLRGGAGRTELIPLGDDCFGTPETSGCIVAFAEHDGARVLHGGLTRFVEEPAWRGLAAQHGARLVLLILASGLLLLLAGGRWTPLWVASAAFFSVPFLFHAALGAGRLGDLNVYTAGIFVMTVTFATASLASVVVATGMPRGWRRAYARLYAAAAVVATLFAAQHGLIGLRLWRW